MPVRRNTSRSRRSAIGAVWLILLVWSLLDSAARAEGLPGGADWQPGVTLSAATHIEFSHGRSASFSSLGAQFSLERVAPQDPFATGLFADVELTSQDSGSRFQMVGAWASYSRGRWKVATTAAYFQPDQRSAMWVHANSIQFEPRSGHKLAIAAIGVIGSSRAPATQLIYKTKLGRVAVALNLGLGGTRPQDFGVSTKFDWNIF